MSELLFMSFDCLSSPTLKLSLSDGNPTTSGWGFGWYPNDDYAVSVMKDTGSKDVGNLTSTLSDWGRFRSTTYLCKVKGAAKKYSQQDTQPFQRSFGGRDWLFIHNGDLDKAKTRDLLGHQEGFLEPIGSTDSEIAFCYLLKKLQTERVKRIADIPWNKYTQWLAELDQLGTADIVLSDGQNSVIFHGKNSKQELFYLRSIPPHIEDNKISGESIAIDFSDPLDTYRSAFLVSTTKLNKEGWTKMTPGQLLIVRRSSIIWDSHFGQLQNIEIDPNIKKSNFSSIQNQQSQNLPKVTNIKSIIHGSDGRPLEYRVFKISHTTKYVYSKEVERSTHLLRLQPTEDKTQEVTRSTLLFSAEGEQLYYEDVFGNQAIHITVEKPYSNLEIKVESEVKIYASPIDNFNNQKTGSTIPLVWMPWQRQMMLPYLLPPELPESQLLELSDFAMSFVERGDYSLIDTLKEMNQHIYKDFNYVPGHTTNQTTPFEVYSSRKGVCQDFANLFICLARLLSIPSRYRMGYIYTGANYANKIQSEASHAWVEVYLPYLGWRGFDPTNGCAVGQEHIRVACGRNYRDATPTAGTIYKGGGNETLQVNVKVEDASK